MVDGGARGAAKAVRYASTPRREDEWDPPSPVGAGLRRDRLYRTYGTYMSPSSQRRAGAPDREAIMLLRTNTGHEMAEQNSPGL
jgi:hypothetical protein